MNNKLNVKDMKDELVAFHKLINDILKLVASKNRTVFNIDFNMIFQHVWKRNPGNDIPKYKDYGNNLINLLLDENNNNFKNFDIYFTLPSYLELLDSFNHHLEYIDSFRNKSHLFDSLNKRKFESILLDNENITQMDVEKDIQSFLSVADVESTKMALNRIRKLIGQNGIFIGQDDLFGNKIKFSKNELNNYNELFNRMQKVRSFNDGRNEINRNFHYKIDAANIVTTMQLASDRKINSKFITYQSLASTFCKEEGVNVKIPYLWLSSMLLSKVRYSDDISKFKDILIDTLDLIDILIRELSSTKLEFIDKLPPNYVAIQNILFDDYLRPLHHNKNIMENNNNIAQTFDSYMKFQSKIEENRETIVESVKKFNEESFFIIDKKELRDFDLEEDPIVAKIRKNFKI